MPSLDFIPSLSGGAGVSLTIESDPPGAGCQDLAQSNLPHAVHFFGSGRSRIHRELFA